MLPTGVLMATKPATKSATKPATIAQYIEAAPAAGHGHLRRLHALLKQAAPAAQEALKWNTPFFIEPRFVFAFAAHKAHCSFSPGAATMKHFHKELASHRATDNLVQMPYAEPLPEDLIRRMAAH
ncbi:MAG: DUF1801 domain-containing protein, partial [Lysobacteraceae bacterium]